MTPDPSRGRWRQETTADEVGKVAVEPFGVERRIVDACQPFVASRPPALDAAVHALLVVFRSGAAMKTACEESTQEIEGVIVADRLALEPFEPPFVRLETNAIAEEIRPQNAPPPVPRTRMAQVKRLQLRSARPAHGGDGFGGRVHRHRVERPVEIRSG